MRVMSRPYSLFFASVLALALAGCQSGSYRWGASEDTEWSARAGSARMADAVSALGQPRETLRLANGETKARWIGRELTISPELGTMEDHSIQRTEARPLWRDMLFSTEGVLLRAWMTDQRRLADSEAP